MGAEIQRLFICRGMCVRLCAILRDCGIQDIIQDCICDVSGKDEGVLLFERPGPALALLFVGRLNLKASLFSGVHLHP